MKRKTKRTAGERRYRTLQRKVDSVQWQLTYAQQHISDNEQKLSGIAPAKLMQYITEAKERLK